MFPGSLPHVPGKIHRYQRVIWPMAWSTGRAVNINLEAQPENSVKVHYRQVQLIEPTRIEGYCSRTSSVAPGSGMKMVIGMANLRSLATEIAYPGTLIANSCVEITLPNTTTTSFKGLLPTPINIYTPGRYFVAYYFNNNASGANFLGSFNLGVLEGVDLSECDILVDSTVTYASSGLPDQSSYSGSYNFNYNAAGYGLRMDIGLICQPL